eukprot:TRINITY_DN15036_c0_g1_i2.p1 TRINITY_DN15036_c0_g1~~TRINITY_DN15036_c0_g1_i2.p1  ORF type:complete len:817 (+),score=260.43 TRINITY_DN15036_c0_g1_i2:114-2564(+)
MADLLSRAEAQQLTETIEATLAEWTPVGFMPDQELDNVLQEIMMLPAQATRTRLTDAAERLRIKVDPASATTAAAAPPAETPAAPGAFSCTVCAEALPSEEALNKHFKVCLDQQMEDSAEVAVPENADVEVFALDDEEGDSHLTFPPPPPQPPKVKAPPSPVPAPPAAAPLACNLCHAELPDSAAYEAHAATCFDAWLDEDDEEVAAAHPSQATTVFASQPVASADPPQPVASADAFVCPICKARVPGRDGAAHFAACQDELLANSEAVGTQEAAAAATASGGHALPSMGASRSVDTAAVIAPPAPPASDDGEGDDLFGTSPDLMALHAPPCMAESQCLLAGQKRRRSDSAGSSGGAKRRKGALDAAAAAVKEEDNDKEQEEEEKEKEKVEKEEKEDIYCERKDCMPVKEEAEGPSTPPPPPPVPAAPAPAPPAAPTQRQQELQRTAEEKRLGVPPIPACPVKYPLFAMSGNVDRRKLALAEAARGTVEAHLPPAYRLERFCFACTTHPVPEYSDDEASDGMPVTTRKKKRGRPPKKPQDVYHDDPKEAPGCRCVTFHYTPQGDEELLLLCANYGSFAPEFWLDRLESEGWLEQDLLLSVDGTRVPTPENYRVLESEHKDTRHYTYIPAPLTGSLARGGWAARGKKQQKLAPPRGGDEHYLCVQFPAGTGQWRACLLGVVVTPQSVPQMCATVGARDGRAVPRPLSQADLVESVTLKCPLTFGRMTLPARGAGCTHTECFDLPAFLNVSLTRSIWGCPICARSLPYHSLLVDPVLSKVVTQSPASVHQVWLRGDGTWTVAQADGARAGGGDCIELD